MSNIDKQALREAAEKALPAMKRLLMMPNDELFDEALLNVDGDVDAANAFNLLTGPETVLALLDELEAKEEQRANWFQMAQKLGEDLDAAEKRIAELEAKKVTIKLPESFYPDGDIDCPLVINEYQIIEAIVAADCKPIAVCPRCKRELDLTHKPDGAHYCHAADAGKGE